MNEETRLRQRLQKIEALFSGTSYSGEKSAAAESIKRIKEQIQKLDKIEPHVETRCSMPDQWSRQLFVALCRRYGLKPFRYARQRYTTVMVKAPRSFIDNVLWPEYEALSDALTAYLQEITAKIIKEEIHKDIEDVQEVDEMQMLN